MEENATRTAAEPPPLPKKPTFKPALYAKMALLLAMAVNAAAQVVGVEFDARIAGRLIGAVVVMPVIVLGFALFIWRVSGRNPLPADIILATLSAFFVLSSLGQLAQNLLAP